MNDNQINMIMEAAQKVFLDELKDNIDEIEKLLDNYKNESTEIEENQILRFFHSINGTGSTLGLFYLSSIGKKWEKILRDIIQQGQSIDKNTLQDIYLDIMDIKKKINYVEEKNNTVRTMIESNEYVNMLNRGKILLIDDDITILKLLENTFTTEGYNVYICDDSPTAMDMVAVTRPDIIILDIMMPGFNGYEILDKIKSRPEYSDIYVIFLSGKGDVNDKIKGLKAGADDYISKPFVIGELVSRVEMLMRRSNNYKEKLLKDSLTDAYSRYYFNLRLAEELERYKRYGTIFSIAFIDMDHYKYINDQYGHQTGDNVLKELVSYISKNIRKCDSIYRYGGEEFIILLPDTTKEKAYTLMERLRQGFSSEPISVGGNTINVTFSAGIKQVCDKCESVEKIINDADKAMYYAKKSGRNKVFIYNEEIEVQDLKKTLLIVDDENTILNLLRDRLTNMGYNIITAKDGMSAIELARDKQPDLVILDLILPDVDGYKVCREIKENALTHLIKVIMISKKTETDSIVRGLYLGADDYITKPFSIAELEARIMRILNSTY